jgi:hypothetical protein
MGGSGSESCQVAGFGTSGVEPSSSVTTVLFREMSCEEGRWTELAQNRVQWRAVLNLRVSQPQC